MVYVVMDFEINYSIDFRDLENQDIIEIFEGIEDVDSIDTSGDTLLLYACKEYNERLVEYALTRGANPDFVNDCGEAPLHEVINIAEHREDRALSILKLLLDNGADIELRAYMDKTPFLKACSRNSITVIEFLVQNGANTKATVEEAGKLLDGAFYSGVFSESPEVRNLISRLVNS